MRQRTELNHSKLTQYVWTEKQVFSVIFRVVNSQGNVYSLGFEAIGLSAVEAYSDALTQLKKYNARETAQLLKLETMSHLESLAYRIREVNRYNWD